MQIERIDVYRVAIPFKTGDRRAAHTQQKDAFNAAAPNISRMESLMVRITTDTGQQGWGEAFGHGSNPVTFVALRDLVGPFFLRTSIEAHENAMALAQQAFHGFGQSGPMIYALSAIDMALWDLRAQRIQTPLYAMLGGKIPDLRLYASLVSYQGDEEAVRREVSRVHQLGYGQVKLHEREYGAIAAARDALGADSPLMVDVNCPWSVDQAYEKAAEFKSLDLAWLEEPVWPPDDIEGLARVRKAGVPVSAGENVSGVLGFRQLFRAEAVDVAQPSVAKVGGISGMLDVFRMADAYGVTVVPHCFYYGPGLMATAHLVASRSDRPSLEMPFIHFEERLHPFMAFGPQMVLPDKPGIGFEVDERILAAHLIDEAALLS